MLIIISRAKKTITIFLSVMIVLSTIGLNVSAAPAYGSEWDGYYHNATTTYSDVPDDHWAYDAVMRSTEKNWFSGYPDGRFKPDGSITRAEALKVFVVFLGLELKDVTESTFYDVNPREWYAPYIEAGKDLFPTHTTIQGKRPFQPDMPVTREDTIYALVNALGYHVGVKYADQSILNMFNDKNSISNDIKSYFAVAINNKLVSGFPDGTIRAQDSLTRAEFATLLYRGSFVGFNDSYEAIIESVNVVPATHVELTIGESVTLSARATYSDKSEKDYSQLQPYVESGNSLISLSDTTITALKEGVAVIKYKDSYLKSNSLTVVVNKPTEAPVLKVTDYDEITKESSMKVKGMVTNKNGTVDLTCNGKDIVVKTGGNFETKVSLVAGENVFKFVATNSFGVTSEKSITIVREEVKEETPKTEKKEPEVEKEEKSKETTESKADKTTTMYGSEETTESKSEKTPSVTTTSSTLEISGSTLTKCKESAKKVVVPETNGTEDVFHIGDNAFSGCSHLEEIVLHNKLKSIKERAFADCTNLRKIVIPETVKDVGVYAFSNCKSLKEVSFNGNIKTLKSKVFVKCSSLEKITLPNTLKTIDSEAFAFCSSLKEVRIPEGTTSIKTRAFYNCSALEKIVIPASVNTIDELAFEGCSSLVICAPVNSYAIEYARDKGIPWESM